jgi:hypothetical protein
MSVKFHNLLMMKGKIFEAKWLAFIFYYLLSHCRMDLGDRRFP